MLKLGTRPSIRRRRVCTRGFPKSMAEIPRAIGNSPGGLLRSSVAAIRLILALSILIPSPSHADPPSNAALAPSLSGTNQGNQGATGQNGSTSSGSGTTSGQNATNSSGGSKGQGSASSTGASDSSTNPPTDSFVAPNTDDLENDPRGKQVIALFKEVLARKPNSRELSDRVGDLVTNRTTLAAMRSELLASDERYKLQVNSLYSKYLGRPIDQPSWDGLVKANPRPTMDALKSALERSDEYKKRQIIDLYIKHLDRAPDSKALQALLQANAGQPLNTLQLENDLRFSTEYAIQWYINAYAQRLKKCPSADEIKAIVPLLTSKKATYAQAAQGLDAQVPRDFDGSSLVVKDPIPSLCPNAFDNTSKQARTQLANYALTSVQTKISNPRDFQIADLRNRLANLRAEIEKQTSLLNGTRQNISSLKKQLDELTGLSYAVAAASGTVTATKRNLDGMRDLETEQAARLEQLQQSARTLEGIIAEFEAGGGDDDLYYSAPNERLRTVITTDASREADRKFGEELSRASYKLAIAEGGLKATQQGLVSLAVVGTVVLSGGATAPILLTAAANGSVIAFISSRSEAVGQVSAGNLTYTEAHNKATNDFLRGTGLACITAASVGTGGLTKIGVQSLSKATLARMSEGSAAYRVVYWTSPSAAFFASGSASSGVSSAVSNVPTWVSGEKSAAEVAQIIGVDMLFGGLSGIAGGTIKNPIVDAGVDLALATTQSVVKGEIDPNRPQETTEAILGNLISTATSSAVAKLQSNIEKQQKGGGTAPINNANAAQSSDAILREAITKLAPKGTLDAVMQKIQQDVLQKGDVTNVLPVDILSRIPGLDPIKKPKEYEAAVAVVSKALEQAKGARVFPRVSRAIGDILDGIAPPTYDEMLSELPDQLVRRVKNDWAEKTAMVNGQELAKGNISEGYINPASPDGALAPWRHCKGKQPSESPWVSFTDPTNDPWLANGNPEFGGNIIRFSVRKYLEEARSLGIPASQVVVLSKPRLGKYLKGRLEMFLNDCKGKNSNAIVDSPTIQKLYELMENNFKDADSDKYAMVLKFLKEDMNLSNTKAKDALDDYCKPWMHYRRNGEALFLGKVSLDARFIDSNIIANFKTE